MRKSREDWLEIGLKTLGQDGHSGLTIQRLARKLRLTKGSFYHHFANIAGYKSQLIAFWADEILATIPADPQDPAAALALLDAHMADAYSPASKPEAAIRAWAQQDKEVHAYVEKVDEARRALYFQILLSLTGDVILARRMADLLFAMLLGASMALPRYAPQRMATLYAEFKRLYGIETA